MKIFPLAASVMLIAHVGSAAGHAQSRVADPAAKLPSSVGEIAVKNADAVRVLNAYAACVVKTNRRGVERALSTASGAPGSDPAMLKLMTQDCLDSGELRFKPSLIRGAFFEQLYRTDAVLLKIQDLKAAPSVDYRLGAPMPYSNGLTLHLGLMDFADCVVRAVPASAQSLVLSRVASSQETNAFADLSPRFRSCLTDGVELEFSRPVLRGVVAEALYRVSAANAGYAMFAKKN